MPIESIVKKEVRYKVLFNICKIFLLGLRKANRLIRAVCCVIIFSGMKLFSVFFGLNA
jgi:hypothetical protein